ncbi:sensor histidine kinase [Parafilimonas terrae]|nr:histidine kinase [Parafilimonas terrae]
MNKITVLLAFIWLFLATVKTNAQEYNYYHYDVKDGLSGINVYSIAQDKDGFLWFGTETGLSRFDGENFKNFTVSDGLFDNDIIYVFADSKNRVWIFPFKNSIYYYYQGKIHNESNDPLLKKFNIKNEIFRACEDKYGNIFFIETERLHILSIKDTLTEINSVEGQHFINQMCNIDKEGKCNLYINLKNWPMQHASIYRYENGAFTYQDSLYNYNFARNTFEINAEYTVIRNGPYFKINNKETNEHFDLKVPAHFRTVSYIDNKTFAISTFYKTLIFDIYQKKVVDSFLTNQTVNKCFKDHENNLWFGTMTEGVYRLSSTKVKVYKTLENGKQMPVYAVGNNNDRLFIGSAGSLWYLTANKLHEIKVETNYNISKILLIEILNNRELILGSDIGLFVLNNGKDLGHLGDIAIKDIFIDTDSFLTATDRGVFKSSLKNLSVSNAIWNSRTTCIYETEKNYYIGTLNGLYIKNKFSHAFFNLGDDALRLRDKIIKIVKASNGDLWVATENNGIITLRNDKIIYQVTNKFGLTSNSCRCLYIYKNYLWVGTDKGISRVDISKYPFKITNYTAADGLDCEIINCIYASGDSVFAGTPYGLTFFNANTALQKSICNLKLLNIQSNEANWYAKQDSIHLSSRDNLLRFEYAGISFVSAGDITYYYQLNGLSDEWQSTRQNVLEFPSLYPGEYALNMYAVNKYGVKSNMLTVHFTKAKHYWQLLWVQVLLLLILVTLMWLVARARIRSVRRKADENLLREKRINELEQMALKAQMNPHFIFNSINSIQQYVFSGNVAEANEYITDFSLLVRQTLDMSGKKFITLAEEIMYLGAYLGLEQKKYEHCFNFTITIEENTERNMLLPPLLIQPFVENSIRHGVLNLKKGRGKILVHFFKDINALYCMVEDNGIGRAKAIQLKKNVNPVYESKGMELVKNRIESLNNIYNSDITVAIEDIDEQHATGTRVIIKFPLDYDEQNN